MSEDLPCLALPADLAHVRGRPAARARIRATDDDFQVDEVLGFEPPGEGAHAWLLLQKRGLNTQMVVSRLARLAAVRGGEVGFSGMKDRHAVCTQWFSVNLEGLAGEPDWAALEGPDLSVLRVSRAPRKLRRGGHQANRFSLVLRALAGDVGELRARLEAVTSEGVPNYFGEQRFGWDGGNLTQAYAMFAQRKWVRDRHARGLYLSAARSLLFNRVLSQRVSDGTWNRALAGDVMMLEGTHSVFSAPRADAGIENRVAEGDIHPTGPMWGRGELRTQGVARELEDRVLDPCGPWRIGLEKAGLRQERRALRLPVKDLEWDLDSDQGLASVCFTLPSGAFATMVLRELVQVRGR